MLLLSLVFGAAPAQAQRMTYSRMDPVATAALTAFRQTDHWLATAMASSSAGKSMARRETALPSLAFDASRHLEYLVVSLPATDRKLVFLLFNWVSVRGNGPAPGVVMQQYGANPPFRWRLACDFKDSDGEPHGGVTLLDRRSHGWRQFQTESGRYGWSPARDGSGAMDCVLLTAEPSVR